ncbi:MAG TPA: FkbM family methyltransferase [Ferruginibacter sp.]|nr:FkbM family methyltransferase [Ferruginibacter sp.]
MYITIEQLIEKFNIKITGVLHVGAHQAEEAVDYDKANIAKVIWIEGNPELMTVLASTLKKYPTQIIFNTLISDKDDELVNFNVTNNFQSSSLLDLGTHKSHHPEVVVHHTLALKTYRLDTFFKTKNITAPDYNFLNIDIQGAELLAIKGLGDNLKYIDYIYTEVNVGAVYKGCATLLQMDNYLHQHGFIRVATTLTEWQWGDAFYIKKGSTKIQQAKNILEAAYYQFFYTIKTINKSIYTTTRRILGKIKRRLFTASPSSIDIIDPNTNGERAFFIDLLKKEKGEIVLFDVGANVGDYTKMLLQELQSQARSDYAIHLFEPQNKCYVILCNEFKNDDRIIINNFALSDSKGAATIHYDHSGSTSASLFKRAAISLDQSETIILETLENYITDKKIENITLLKIDTEGNEKKVLLGGGKYIHPTTINAIQFEYGGTYLDANITLAEVVQLLINNEYTVGKIVPGKIMYSIDLGQFIEDYTYSNYAAIKKNLQ